MYLVGWRLNEHVIEFGGSFMALHIQKLGCCEGMFEVFLVLMASDVMELNADWL